MLNENTIKILQDALALALLMLDAENQPPQFTRAEAFEQIKPAYDLLTDYEFQIHHEAAND